MVKFIYSKLCFRSALNQFVKLRDCPAIQNLFVCVFTNFHEIVAPDYSHCNTFVIYFFLFFFGYRCNGFVHSGRRGALVTLFLRNTPALLVIII